MSFNGRSGRSGGGIDLAVDRLHQRGFPHAARAPEEGVVRGQSARKPLGVFDKGIAHPVDAAQQGHLDPVDAIDRRRVPLGRMPDESVSRAEVGDGRTRRCQPL
jgi:hypothetical protein